MRAIQRVLLTVAGLGAVALIAGCGGGSSGAYGASGNPTSGTTTTTSSGAALVKTATATVGGTSETILTNAQGMTLYYFDPDTSSTVACTGSCAQNWPPLLEGNGSLQAPAGVTGTISVVNGANGKQVEYNGHPLYTYAGDSAPGQTTGDGVLGKWHVATPNIPINGGSSGGGYSGY
jgi:predicted lipoprotein with Yx(FWY)xxD motif